jgi:hypothetical protein
MIDGFPNAQIIAALIAVLVASYAAFFGWLVTSIRGLRREMHALNRETRQDLGSRIDALTGKVDGLVIAVSRLEGAVYHGLPQPRRAVSEQ